MARELAAYARHAVLGNHALERWCSQRGQHGRYGHGNHQLNQGEAA
jgi:hypothetical protein